MEIKSHVTIATKPGNLKGIASISFDDEFVVKGLRIYETEKGPFVSMPAEKVNGEYRDNCFPITANCREKVNQAVLNAYQLALEQKEEQTNEHKNSQKRNNRTSKPQKSETKQKAAEVSEELSKERQEPEVDETMGPTLGM